MQNLPKDVISIIEEYASMEFGLDYKTYEIIYVVYICPECKYNCVLYNQKICNSCDNVNSNYFNIR